MLEHTLKKRIETKSNQEKHKVNKLEKEIWACPKYPITKSGHRKEIGGGVRPHAGFSKIQHKYNENKAFGTFYKKILACRGSPCTPDLKFSRMFRMFSFNYIYDVFC